MIVGWKKSVNGRNSQSHEQLEKKKSGHYFNTTLLDFIVLIHLIIYCKHLDFIHN